MTKFGCVPASNRPLLVYDTFETIAITAHTQHAAFPLVNMTFCFHSYFPFRLTCFSLFPYFPLVCFS